MNKNNDSHSYNGIYLRYNLNSTDFERKWSLALPAQITVTNGIFTAYNISYSMAGTY